MTKSGGFSIKKRHRKLGALIGLAALAVPFAANLGTLGDAIHAVTGPQNVYESELLNVKLKTSQDKTKTTWDLEFDRSDMKTVSEQTVKFKLDLEKAGLKDAEIAVKDGDKLGDPLDMREGIVSAVLKTQSTHLILTAISTNEDKHDITLPVTELGLYNEENGENLLPADNRSVDLTMAFEKVAEITEFIKEEAASSSETLTEAVTDEEQQSGANKSERIFGNDDNQSGKMPADFATDLSNLGEAIAVDDTIIIQQDARTSMSGTTTNPDGFQWSAKYTSGTNTVANTAAVQPMTPQNLTTRPNNDLVVWQKFNRNAATVDGTSSAPGWNNNHEGSLRAFYYDKFGTTDGTDNLSSYLFEFRNLQQSTMNNAELTIAYDNVGVYYDDTGASHQMGAIMTIDNIQAQESPRTTSGINMASIDVPNKLSAGILYQGIESLDIKLQFFAVNDEGDFTNPIKVVNSDLTDSDSVTRMTFGSLNNHGVGSDNDAQSVVNSNTPAAQAESVTQGTIGVQEGADPVFDENTIKLSTSAQSGNRGALYYSVTRGDYTHTQAQYQTLYDDGTKGQTIGNVTVTNDTTAWVDWLGRDTYPRGAVSFPISGTQFEFTFHTGSGNTWQSINMARLGDSPFAEAPKKTVTTVNNYIDAKAEKDNAVAGTTTQYGTLDGESVSQLATNDESDGKDYFYYNYWVFQKTYSIGGQGLLKPKTVTMTDTLPLGVTLRTSTAADNITVYPTQTGTGAPTALDKNNYSVNVEPAANGQQTITVTINANGMKNITFNGGDIAWKMNVKVDADSANENVDSSGQPKPEGLVWTNEADVTGKTKKTSNEVTTKLKPMHGKLQLTLEKVDGSGLPVSDATFELKRLTRFEDWTGTTYNTTPSETDNTVVNPSQSTRDTWTWENVNPTLEGMQLQAGTYQLSEVDAPAGYDKLDPVTFTINYVRANSGAKPSAGNYDDLAISITDLSGAGVEQDDTSLGIQLTATDTPKKVEMLLQKLDGNNDALKGASFKIQKMVNGTAVGDEEDLVPDTTDSSKFSLPEGWDTLEFNRNNKAATQNIYYKVTEDGAPSGYALNSESFYFAVYSKADIPAETSKDLTGDVFVSVTDDQGVSKGTYTAASFNNDKYTIGLNVDNYAKSIFPRVGGTGIQAYIGAGLIVMLIAGGAAWYIKRRQNQ